MRRLALDLRRFILLTGLYYAGGALTSLYLRTSSDVTLFWPGAGIGLAIAARYGTAWVAVIPVALLLLHLSIIPVPPEFLWYSLAANTLATLAAGWAITRRVARDALRVRSFDGLLLLKGGALLALLGALLGTVGLVESGMLPRSEAVRAATLWFLGDLLGVTTVAPFLSVTLGQPFRLWAPKLGGGLGSLRERALWAALLMLSLAALYTAGVSGELYAPLGLISLPLGLLLWSAVRFSPLLTMLATGLTVVALSVLTGVGLGGYERPVTLLDASVLIMLLTLVSVVPVLLAIANHEQRKTALALYRRATCDTLTGLYNRSAFEERARERLAGEDRDLTLLYLDLDHFKLVNDSASHVAGDDLIRAVGSLVDAEFPEPALVARTGGDEFAALVPATVAATVASARRLLAAVDSLRVEWQGQQLSTTSSIGLAHSRAPHGDFDTLLSHADAACFAAKELGGHRLVASDPRSDEARQRAATMRSALQVREALDRQRFQLFCQPIVHLDHPTRAQRHFEILLRWTDAEGRLRAPAELIAAAERYRLGPRLDRYVADAVLGWLEEHPHAAGDVQHCAINLGGATLVDDDFADYLAGRLRRSPVPPQRLCFEITETSVVRDRARAQRFIGRLRDLGCRFALDDFGTGFCSFGYLQDLDVDYLKIDGSFVRGLEQSPLAEAVVRSITDIAHVLDKRTIAEQAETASQLVQLRRMGVDYAQGFVFARPQPIADFFAQADDWTAHPRRVPLP